MVDVNVYITFNFNDDHADLISIGINQYCKIKYVN